MLGKAEHGINSNNNKQYDQTFIGVVFIHDLYSNYRMDHLKKNPAVRRKKIEFRKEID